MAATTRPAGMDREEQTEVLVVGGGLTGLAMAVFLRGHGVRTMLVERHPGTSVHPRARGVSPRTMELLRAEGLEQQVRSTASARALAANEGIEAMTALTGEVLAKLDQPYLSGVHADLSEHSPTGWCMCDQDELEPLLRDEAARRGADLRFGTRLADYAERDGGISARIEPANGTGRPVAVRARYLIAADGADSAIRGRLGIELSGPGTLAHYLNIYFSAELAEALGDRRFVLGYVINKHVRGALLPVDNATRWMLHVPFDPAKEQPADFPAERCIALVRAAAGLPELPVTIRSVLPWEAAGRTAQRWRAGRVLLIGDAAHLMPPTGAFGSNTGVQDAHNLAWKLAAVLRTGNEQLLDSYEAERRPVAAATVEQAVLRSKDRPRLVGQPTPPPDGLIADTTVIFGGRYLSGAVLSDAVLPDGDDAAGAPWDDSGRAVAGVRVPQAWLSRAGRRRSVLDLLGRHWQLFVAGAAPADLRDGLPRERYGHPVRCLPVRLGEPADADSELGNAGSELGNADSAELIDSDGSWAERWGLEPGEAVLVRPDDIVAWRGPVPMDTDALAALLDKLVGVPG